MKSLSIIITCLTGSLLFADMLGADTLGFVEQRFDDIHFEKGKWSRTEQLPCFQYIAEKDGAEVDVLRTSFGNFIPFKARKGMKVTVCHSVIAFEEGFETGPPKSDVR